ncbi:hypothetical protein LG288_11580 [Idiomarina seosinensis]|uniref:hypothetical protein n=1 Tax=Idiomarina seosinensis TaxID=281739 RepID=UPI00384E332B
MPTINKLVERLNRYLPFDPGHDQIYEEHASSSDSFNIETKAFSYLVKACSEGANAIVLTGDAGHGKTHLCRRLIEHFCLRTDIPKQEREDESRRIINEKCDGQQSISTYLTGQRNKFRIFKDFSELTVEVAAARLEESLSDSSAVTVLCANEGRLRAALSTSEAGPLGKSIRHRFEKSFEDGLCSTDDSIHVVNLNYQSIAGESVDDSLFKKAFKFWLDMRRWKNCESCESKERCPIFHNRALIDERGKNTNVPRLEQVNLLFKTLERADTVITIREMLMLVAYMLTGGLDCQTVHTKSARFGWARQYSFYNLLFERPSTLTKEQVSSIKTLSKLSRIDPGVCATRSTDDRLINEADLFPAHQIDLEFNISLDKGTRASIDASQGIDQVLMKASSKKERAKEATIAREIVKTLRRRAFFDGIGFQDNPLEKLGFRFGDLFNRIISENVDKNELGKLKPRVVAGLRHIQGIRVGEPKNTLELLDPAFGRMGANGGILAGTIHPQNINLYPLEKQWDLKDSDDALFTSVDWLSRAIVLEIAPRRHEKPRNLIMDLSMFDCLMRASDGHVPTVFYQNDIRRFLDFLGELAESLNNDEENIRVVSELGTFEILLDEEKNIVYVDGQ